MRTSLWEFVVLRLILGLLLLIARALGLLGFAFLWVATGLFRMMFRPLLRELAYVIGRTKGWWQPAGAGRRGR